MKYRKLPIEIEASLWEGHFKALRCFPPEEITELLMERGDLTITTLEGKMTCNIGDYIIRGVNGEYYPCKADIFNKTYEIVK